MNILNIPKKMSMKSVWLLVVRIYLYVYFVSNIQCKKKKQGWRLFLTNIQGYIQSFYQ